MLFNSFYYYVFLLVVFLIYYLVNTKIKWFVLFIASLFFIGTIAPNLILFTLLFTVLNYFLGIAIQNVEKKSLRKTIFWLGISADIGILAFYKYINFLFENINILLSLLPTQPAIALFITHYTCRDFLLYFPGIGIYHQD